ncbi:MAG: lytic transglycosylase domain-containing protein [Sediminibacterium sp.]|jgi:membrane-bound lytic murein transglycosylase D|nr:lytic transglycosylase domain-containing protein [Sediminibacterium sp.]
MNKFFRLLLFVLGMLVHDFASAKTVIADTIIDDKKPFANLFLYNKVASNKPYQSQINPRAISFVEEYIRKQGKSLEKMKVWGKPYFDLYDQILFNYGIPKEMKYLSVIESHLGAGGTSWAGAVGPWQLMPGVAKEYGLNVGGYWDQRTDYFKSTHVAARIMKKLYAEFDDWLLVVAAYNCGNGCVRSAIRRAKSKDFWQLQYFLPEETRNHVKKFIATHLIFEGAGGFTTMTAAEVAQAKTQNKNTPLTLSAAELAGSALIEVSGRFNSLVVANELQINIQQFNAWNPGFDKALAAGEKYAMRISKEKEAIFLAKKNQLLLASVRAIIEGVNQ